MSFVKVWNPCIVGGWGVKDNGRIAIYHRIDRLGALWLYRSGLVDGQGLYGGYVGLSWCIVRWCVGLDRSLWPDHALYRLGVAFADEPDTGKRGEKALETPITPQVVTQIRAKRQGIIQTYRAPPCKPPSSSLWR